MGDTARTTDNLKQPARNLFRQAVELAGYKIAALGRGLLHLVSTVLAQRIPVRPEKLNPHVNHSRPCCKPGQRSCPQAHESPPAGYAAFPVSTVS